MMAAEKRNPLGATGETVRANIQRLRDDQNLGYTKLSRILEELGRPIPELGLRRIEAGDRRVDVDDLLALAAALGVSPVTLLMPADVGRQDSVEATAVPVPYPARLLWLWLTGADPLAAMNLFAFAERAWPTWVQDKFMAEVTDARRALDERVAAKEVSSGDD
jgi:transcriptional regulator with XRE-family HTH domain